MILEKRHLSNIKSILKNKDITLLNKPTYQYLNLLSGFIAHYNLYGFQNHYTDLRLLINDLKSSEDTDKQVLDLIREYENSINIYFSDEEKIEDLNTIKLLMNKHNLFVILRI